MICIYCARELGLNQQYYHRCKSMDKAGADSPLAITEVKVNDQAPEMDGTVFKAIIEKREKASVVLESVYSHHLSGNPSHTVTYTLNGEEKSAIIDDKELLSWK